MFSDVRKCEIKEAFVCDRELIMNQNITFKMKIEI